MIPLSKSKYTRAVQCPKMLWMDFYKKEVGVNKASESILKTGNEVGDLAMSYFGDFTEVPYSTDKKAMCEETARLMQAGTPVIAEASFLYEDCFCSVDILRKVEGGYELIEVKSSTECKPIYLEDMAYQYYVLTHCNVPVVSVWNMHINNQYERHGELDIKELFALEDHTEDSLKRQEAIAEKIAELKVYLTQKEEPEQEIGLYCDDPYECSYKEYCREKCGVVEPSVFSVAGLEAKKMYALFNDGIRTFSDIVRMQDSLPKGKRLSASQMFQVESEYNAVSTQINKPEVKRFLDTLTYPLYHLDFETFGQAIPEYDRVKPYSMIPFQYSLHVQQAPCAEPEHYEFLGKEGTDPRRALAEQLCKDIPKDVCILAYHKSTEIGIVKNLAKLFPDLSGHLLNISRHILDLGDPFRKRSYYCNEMSGSWSIKNVLPALCPNDPELDYHALEGIHNGGEAMDAFPALREKSPEEAEVIRKQLLAYCRLDTLAMVKVLEKLYQAIEE